MTLRIEKNSNLSPEMIRAALKLRPVPKGERKRARNNRRGEAGRPPARLRGEVVSSGRGNPEQARQQRRKLDDRRNEGSEPGSERPEPSDRRLRGELAP